MNTLNEAQAAVLAAQRRVDELDEAAKFVAAETLVAQAALRGAHAKLQQIKAADQRLRTDNRQAELATLRGRLVAIQGE